MHQGPLPGIDPSAAPRQLTLWERLDVAHQLLAGTPHDRQAKCHRTRRVKGDTAIKRSDRKAWSTSGLVRCGHATCPSCGPELARKTAAALAVAMRRQLGLVGVGRPVAEADTADVWMLSLTIPHYADEHPAVVVDRLYTACETFFRTRTWRDFCADWRVVARVRVLDVTFGGDEGPHPHFHIALFVDGAYRGMRTRSAERRGEMLDALAEAEELTEAWLMSAEHAGAKPRDLEQFRRRGLKLSPSERAARYFTKWGLATEVGATALKRDNHLTLLDRAGAGDHQAGADYFMFRGAIDGRQWVTGVADMCAHFKISDDDVSAYLTELREARDKEAPPELVEPLSLVIREHLYAGALAAGWSAVFRAVDQAEGDKQDALDAFLWRALVDHRAKLRRWPKQADPPDG